MRVDGPLPQCNANGPPFRIGSWFEINKFERSEKFAILHYLRFMGNVETLESNILVVGQFATVQVLRTILEVQAAKRHWLKRTASAWRVRVRVRCVLFTGSV